MGFFETIGTVLTSPFHMIEKLGGAIIRTPGQIVHDVASVPKSLYTNAQKALVGVSHSAEGAVSSLGHSAEGAVKGAAHIAENAVSSVGNSLVLPLTVAAGVAAMVFLKK